MTDMEIEYTDSNSSTASGSTPPGVFSPAKPKLERLAELVAKGRREERADG